MPKRALAWLPSILIIGLAIERALRKGGEDFRVFLHAASLVAGGRTDLLYERTGPDAYLYAPGFAALLAPLSALPPTVALALWSGLKACAWVWMLQSLAGVLAGEASATGRTRWIIALAPLAVARELLIDFQYGQINLWLLVASWWAVQSWLSGAPRIKLAAAWGALGVTSACKLITAPWIGLPLLALAAARTSPGATDSRVARAALMLGAFVIGAGLVLLWGVGVHAPSGAGLHQAWLAALEQKSVPSLSHNQSFAALLARWTSGNLVHLMPWGPYSDTVLGPIVRLTDEQRSLWALGWASISASALIVGMQRLARSERWAVPTVFALWIVPLHLVWKPYFVWRLPLVVAYLGVVLAGPARRRVQGLWVFALLVALNAFAVTDVLGSRVSGYAESVSWMLGVQLAWIGAWAWASRWGRVHA